jgi:hypothetical protein
MTHTQSVPPLTWTKVDTDLDNIEIYHEADGNVLITINDGPPVLSFDADNPPPPGLMTRPWELLA